MNKSEHPAPNRRSRMKDKTAARDEIATHIRTNLVTRVLILQDSTIQALRDGSSAEEGSSHQEVAVSLPELVELLVGYLGGEVPAPVGSGLQPASKEELPREMTQPKVKPETDHGSPVDPDPFEVWVNGQDREPTGSETL